MKRILSVVMAGLLATSASADNLMVSYASPLAAYPAGGPPIVHPIYSFVSTPNYYAAVPFVPTYGYQTAVSPFYAGRYWPNYAYGMNGYGFGYGGYGYDYGYGYGAYMSANPNVPTYSFGYTTGYASNYALNFDGTTPVPGFVAPAFQNEVTTVSMPSVDRGPASTSLNGSAKLTMNVPADAVVTIQGEKTDQTGPTRTFYTPALTGPSAYNVKVMHKVDGKEQESVMTVLLQPNQQSSITVLR